MSFASYASWWWYTRGSTATRYRCFLQHITAPEKNTETGKQQSWFSKNPQMSDNGHRTAIHPVSKRKRARAAITKHWVGGLLHGPRRDLRVSGPAVALDICRRRQDLSWS